MLKQINLLGTLILVVFAFNLFRFNERIVKKTHPETKSHSDDNKSDFIKASGPCGVESVTEKVDSTEATLYGDDKKGGDFMEASGLRAIVTGMEHSGTTALSSILLNAPCVLGALETGFLLADNAPSDFKNVRPFFEWMQRVGGYNYGISSSEGIDAVLSAPNFASMYSTVRHISPLMTMSDDADHCPRPLGLIDKTPRYVYNLTKVMEKAPGVPVIVIMKEYESVRASHEHRGHALPMRKYIRTWNEITESQAKYPGRVLVVKQEVFNDNPDSVMEGVFQFLGMPWNTTYLSMEPLHAKVKKFGVGKLRPITKDAHSPDRVSQREMFKAPSISIEPEKIDAKNSNQHLFHMCKIRSNEMITVPIMPNLIIVGAQKAGTTALYHIFKEAPMFVSSKKKEVHFFDKRSQTVNDSSIDEYDMFPSLDHDMSEYDKCRFSNDYYQLAFSKTHQQGIIRPNETTLAEKIIFEKTPDYLDLPEVPFRIKQILPATPKILVMLRNPVDRAYSQYSMRCHNFRRKGLEHLLSSLDAMIARATTLLHDQGLIHAPPYVEHPEDVPLNATFDDYEAYWSQKDFSLPTSPSNITRYSSMILKGCYSEQLEHWKKNGFQIGTTLKVVQYERFNANKVEVLNEIVDFASPSHDQHHSESDHHQQQQPRHHNYFDTVNVEKDYSPHQALQKEHPTFSDNAKVYLKHFYKPYNDKLADMLGDDWRDIWD